MIHETYHADGPPLPLTPSQIDQLADAIVAKLAARLPAEKTPRMVDRLAAAEALGVSVSTVDRRVADGSIQPVKLGNRVLFDLDAILQSLGGGR